MTDLPPVQRPNGKWYRPRQGMKAVFYMDDDGQDGIAILGTHDIAKARVFATEMTRWKWGYAGVCDPFQTWLRLGYNRRGEQAWIDDPVRGAAAVQFETTDDPEVDEKETGDA